MSGVLDKNDAKLLWILDRDARASLAALAAAVRLSKQNVHARIKRLETRGIIRRYVSVIDSAKLGRTAYRVYVRYQDLRTERERAFIAYLQQHPNVIWVVTCTGPWDLEFALVTASYAETGSAIKEACRRFPEAFGRYEVSISTVNYHFRRDYLVRGARAPFHQAHYGKTPSLFALDETDTVLLRELSKNCRRSNTELGSAIGVSYHTVSDRIRRLEQRQIITGHRILIDWEAIGRMYYKVLLTHAPLTVEQERKLYAWCAARDCLVYLVEVLGSWQLELELEVLSENDVVSLIRDLRVEFPGILKEYVMLKIEREHKLDYAPFL